VDICADRDADKSQVSDPAIILKTHKDAKVQVTFAWPMEGD
jgi:hypothetical protein